MTFNGKGLQRSEVFFPTQTAVPHGSFGWECQLPSDQVSIHAETPI